MIEDENLDPRTYLRIGASLRENISNLLNPTIKMG
jgi:hypothetical protein